LSVEALENRCLLSATLVQDLNLVRFGSSPSQLVDVNGTLFFTADDGVHGTELWKTDGTPGGAVLVKDINPGPDGSSPRNLTNVNGTLFFAAADGVHGLELWKSDGTEAGTVVVKDIVPGPGSADPQFLTNYHGTLFFSAYDGVHGQELWKSDGTEAGTVLVKDINPGPVGSAPSNLTVVHDTLFFSADDGEHGRELWKSDGTEAGTVLVKDIFQGMISDDYGCGPGGSNPDQLTDVNGTLFFAATDDTHGRELWKSDGTEAGTVMVRDIFPGSRDADPQYLTNVGGTLFFVANDGVHGRELWKSDGTEPGTVLVKGILPGALGSAPQHLTDVNGTAYFTANDGVHGRELWKSDGTEAGTVLVKDIRPGSAGAFDSTSDPTLTNVDGTLFFAADDGTHGKELWKSDGTEAGTVLVTDLRPGGTGSNPAILAGVNGTVFFRADDGVHGQQLWSSDGTEDGTTLLTDLNFKTAGSFPDNFTDVNGTLFFTADDGVHGRELWMSDGTGVVLVKDVGASARPTNLINVDGTLFFTISAAGGGVHLWKSDGTEAGTVAVKDIVPGTIGSSSFDKAAANGMLYFFITAPNRQLWKSDGTADGTVLVKNFAGAGSSTQVVNVNGTIFFEADDGVHGGELWKSDGTEAGTVFVKDIIPGPLSGFPTNLINVNGTLFFAANDLVHGRELWKSDGTEAGTVLVKDIFPGPASGIDPQRTAFTDVGGTLFFVANDGVHGYELWKSDGTEAGTVLVKDIVPGGGSAFPTFGLGPELVNVNGTAFFVVNDGVHGNQLWKSDGTEAGTVLVKAIDTGPYGSSPFDLTSVNGILYFNASAPQAGPELWQSDGTEAGTFMVADIRPGPEGSQPLLLTNVNGTLFFSADDGFYGRELWKVGAPAAPPTVEGIVVNDGAVQRSLVTSLTVTFSTQVTLDPGALEVQRQDGSDVDLNITTSVVGGKTVALVTFTGPDIVDGSLADGTYTLTVHHSLVHDGSGQTLAQDATLSFFRLLGDVDGDGIIDHNDLAAAPTVTSVVLNEGDPTNAQVHSITVHFSEAVTLGDGAFSLVPQDGRAITLIVSTAEVDGNTVATITFSAKDVINGALPDEAYTFTIHGDRIHDSLGLALGHDFAGDRSVDFFGADGSDQPDLVGLFHPSGGG
jgi:ELWxxDGT repeat protein